MKVSWRYVDDTGEMADIEDILDRVVKESEKKD